MQGEYSRARRDAQHIQVKQKALFLGPVLDGPVSLLNALLIPGKYNVHTPLGSINRTLFINIFVKTPY